MANGKVVYGSSSYSFAKNYDREYVGGPETVKIVNPATSGKLTPVKRYVRQIYSLTFSRITDSQLASLQAIDAYDGLVTFYPDGDGVGMPSYSGVWQLGVPTHGVPGQHSVTATFTQSVEA